MYDLERGELELLVREIVREEALDVGCEDVGDGDVVPALEDGRDRTVDVGVHGESGLRESGTISVVTERS